MESEVTASTLILGDHPFSTARRDAGTICTNFSTRVPKPFYPTKNILNSVQIVKPLRVCTICGLQAFSEEDLDLFKIHRRMRYERENLCKHCYNEHKQKHRPRARRQLELINNFKKPILCHFCGKVITKLKGREGYSLDIHSLDGNHENWDPENKVPSHKSCHSTHHLRGQIGDKHRAWKGDEATNHTKYQREWRRKRRVQVNE